MSLSSLALTRESATDNPIAPCGGLEHLLRFRNLDCKDEVEISLYALGHRKGINRWFKKRDHVIQL